VGSEMCIRDRILGAPGEVTYRAKVELPSGYTAAAPDSVDVAQDFAEYHSSYTVENGVLTVVRRLLIKKSEVQLTAWEDYNKFRRAITDDESHWIELTEANASGKAKSDAEIDRLLDEGDAAYDRGDITAAQEAYLRVIQLDPKHIGVHGTLGLTYETQHKYEAALQEFRKAQELRPNHSWAYKAIASLLLRTNRPDEAIEEWRKLLKIDPNSRDAAVNLGRLLLFKQKYSEALEVLERAIKLGPENSGLQLSAALAYLKTGQKEKVVDAVRQAVAGDSSYETFYVAGALLADANLELDRAKDYVEQGVRGLETESLKTVGPDEAGLAASWKLAEVWDTLGWVNFRLGNLDKATSYLRSSWNLTQYAVTGDRLAQVYERSGKPREAAHLYQLALASWGGDKEAIRGRYEHLTGKKASDDRPVLLRREADKTFAASPGEELSRMRTIRVTAEARPSANATFSILLSRDKVEDVRYVKGAEALKSMTGLLAATKFNVEFPDENPARIVRRGILMCGTTGCNFVLLVPELGPVE